VLYEGLRETFDLGEGPSGIAGLDTGAGAGIAVLIGD
jgi:hypothetical protein